MVKITKIVEKTLHDEDVSHEEMEVEEETKVLEKVFGKEEAPKKNVEDLGFSDKLGEIFGVDDPEAAPDD